MDAIVSNADAILSAVLLACFGAYLAYRNSRLSRRAAAADRFNAAFSPALAFLDKARRHGSYHDRPDASAFLREAFVSHAAAIEEFRPFVSLMRRKAYEKVWKEYCDIAHAGTVEAVFMAESIDPDDPWKALQDQIRAILNFAKRSL
jgi:hypothetical protein